MPQRSPILKRSESHWQTVPTISCPGSRGNFGSGSSPSTTCRSVRHTAQASTLTSSSPDFGRGTPTCWGCNGVKGLVNTIANMLLGISAVATVKTVGRGQTSSRRFAWRASVVLVLVLESLRCPTQLLDEAALPGGSSMGWLQAARESYPACGILP